MKAIKNAVLVLEDSLIFDGTLTYEDSRITALGPDGTVPLDGCEEVLDAGGAYLCPGLIDLHVHGTDRLYFHEQPEACAEFFLRHGVTNIFPTFYCNLTLEEMTRGLDLVRAAQKTHCGKTIGGVYMEGPYMSGSGSNQKSIRWRGDILPEEYLPLLDAAGDTVRIWAIDPARPGIERFLADVRRRQPDVVFALGHSRATAVQCRQVERYGIRLQTHHGDSGKAPGKAQGTMGAGCDEYTLYHPDMYAELICDVNGVHVQPDLIKMVVRTKGTERVILITDCMPMSGDYTNNEEDGVAWGPDLNYDYEGHLAGSHLTLENACRNLMQHAGYGICQAVRMASLNPARLLGLDGDVGSLAVGKKANMILTNDRMALRAVFLEGERIPL